MPDDGAPTNSPRPLINIDGAGLAEPARLLVEKCSDAVGGWLRPWQMRRVGAAEADVKRLNAEAEGDAKLSLAMADVRINTLQRRALERLAAEEATKQQNIESITAAALPMLNADARPQNVERDWIVNFFDKSRLTSDEEMQQLWARILAGEANSPGKFSRRTVNLLATLDTRDAALFQTMCRFRWSSPVDHRPIVFDFGNPIYTGLGINFDSLNHLTETGLILFEPTVGYAVEAKNAGPPNFLCTYFDQRFYVVPGNHSRALRMGSVMLTRSGIAICDLCAVDPVPHYAEYVTDCWRSEGAKVHELPMGALS